MKKKLIICFAIVTLFSLAHENYIGFFVNTIEIELSDRDDNNGNDSGKTIEKEDLTEKEKYFDANFFLSTNLVTKCKFYILHTISFPAPYTSQLKMPPRQV